MNVHPNPFIYLNGFQSKELISLIDLIYYGVADVFQDSLDNFLSKAKEFQLKGLTGGSESEEEQKQGMIQPSFQKMKQPIYPNLQCQMSPYF